MVTVAFLRRVQIFLLTYLQYAASQNQLSMFKFFESQLSGKFFILLSDLTAESTKRFIGLAKSLRT